MIHTFTFDWRRTLLHGVTLAAEDRDFADEDPASWQAVWCLLKEAAQVSRSFDGPPRSDYPEKAIWPDAPDEVTHYQRMAAYLRGEVDEAPSDEPLPPIPSAAEVTRADMVLDAWHRWALRRGGHPHPHKRHIYRLASGATLGTVCRLCGEKLGYVLQMRRDASVQMLRGIGVN